MFMKGQVVFRYLTTTGQEVLPDKMVIVQDKKGKCDQQALEIHDKMVFRWAEPRPRYS